MQYLKHNNCSNNKVWNNFKKTHTHTHTYTSSKWQITCQTLKTLMTHLSSQTTPTLNSPFQPQPTKFWKKKKLFSHILFSWETKKIKVVISLHNLLSDLLYQRHIFKQRQCLRGPKKICDTKWVEIVYGIIIYRHGFETWIVQRIV